MPTWGEILKELQAYTSRGQPPNFDAVRRKYLVELSQHTGRATILYQTKFATPGPASPDLLSINDEDLQGLMEVMHGLNNPSLDLILHSPGGTIEAAEALVSYLRSKFQHIRVIVPNLAMSAATMISCAGNCVMMGKHSFLGPIDPQFIINTAVGLRSVSAEAIREQFELAQKECKDPTNLGAWIPMLSQYGPDLLIKCDHACAMSKTLVQSWLAQYMFKGSAAAKRKAAKIAKWLARHRYFKTHGRHIPREALEKQGMLIDHLEADEKLQDLALSVFHATNLTFNGTPVVKIIENHEGRAFIKALNVAVPFQGAPQIALQPIVPIAPTPVVPVQPPTQPATPHAARATP
jgi:Serine dehydrogenase proteinase